MRSLGLAFLLTGALTLSSTAQEDLHTFEVGSIRIEGNETLGTAEILDVMHTRPTPWWFWKFIYRDVSEGMGQEPQYFNPLEFASDYTQVKDLYRARGFYHASVDTSVSIDADAQMVNLLVRIVEGPRSYVDTLEYRGLAGMPGDLLEDIRTNQILKLHQPFIAANVDAEVARVIRLFANNGYVNARVDTPIVATGYASSNNFSVILSFNPGRRYVFGDISLHQDTASTELIDTSVVLRHLDYVKGDFYSESKKTDSERNLNRLGIFESSRIENRIPAAAANDLEIPTTVRVRPRPFQELTPEVGVNDQDNALNVLAGLGYNNRNFLGGARSFGLHAQYSLQSIGNARLNNLFTNQGLQDSTLVSKLEFSMQLLQPYFINNKTTIGGTLSYTLDKQPAFYSPVFDTRVTVTAQTATYTQAIVDWDLRREDPTSVTTQQSLERIENYTRQFNSILTFTLQRDKRNDLFSPSEGFFHSASIQEAGILPRIFGGLFGSDIPYAQYIKVSGVGQWYWDPSGRRTWIWAFRLRGGGAWLYGHSPADLPFTEKFYVGGSGSVRGWQTRELGAVPFPDLGGNALLESSLEGRWNLLRGAGKFLALDLEKFSVVFFLDDGNIWTEPRRIRLSEVALAGGFGLRYDTVAGPIRIDFGTKVYDPSAPVGEQWITDRSTSLIVHFGVGHAF
ncbi:MAG TPA: BamA/TamA family outer membrane protein [Bacteroidota bacterium]|nr:BamA/TamA family outer membrane protein [Bacteroidota bacterium]